MDIDVENIIEKNTLRELKNGLVLTEGQLNVLNKYKINVENCSTLHEVIFLIISFLNDNDELDDEEYEEIDQVCSDIAERNYYNNTNK